MLILFSAHPVLNSSVVTIQAQHRISRPDFPIARVLPGRSGLASQERVLPDDDSITGRFLTGAWEHDLDSVSSDAVLLLKTALEVRLYL